jgi:Arc/MetJ-type ribon-helix-helix transcriptional regulator
MTIALAKDVEDFLQDKVQAGNSFDASKMVNEVLRAVRDRQRKELKPLKLETPEMFHAYLRVLWDELYWANYYYEIFEEIQRLCQEHNEAFKFSPYFWDSTLRAHYYASLLYLHRIYDQHNRSFNLHRFLLTVRNNPKIFDLDEVRKRRAGDLHADSLIRYIGPLDPKQLESDIEYSSDKTNSKVSNLKSWRDRVTFHKDERELFRQKPFEEEYPLPHTDVKELLDRGFDMLNRYSQFFDTRIYSRGFHEWKDIEFVFEALDHHPKAIRGRLLSQAEKLLIKEPS